MTIGMSAGLQAQTGIACGHYQRDSLTNARNAAAPWRIADQFGNYYSPAEIALPDNTSMTQALARFQPPTCTAGYFTLFFEDAINDLEVRFDDPVTGGQYQAVVCKVFRDLSALLNHGSQDGRVRIQISSVSGGVTWGGLATSYYGYPNSPGFSTGILDNEVYKTIRTGQDSYLGTPWAGLNGSFHGKVTINFGTLFQTGLCQPYGAANFDLYTVVLHEALHLLGIHSLLEPGAAPGTAISGISLLGQPPLFFYNRFDQRLRITSSPAQGYLSNFNNWTGASLTAGCGNAAYFGFSPSSGNIPLMAPAIWVDGSSLSHFGCHNSPPNSTNWSGYTSGFVMKPFAFSGAAFVQRSPALAEAEVLCDLGYSLSGTYGVAEAQWPCMVPVTYANIVCSSSTICNPIGVNDFYSAVQASGTPQATIDVSLNDINAGSGFLQMMVVSGGNNSNLTFGAGNITVNPPAWATQMVLAYTPLCDVEGAWTFVFVEVEGDLSQYVCPAVGCGENVVCYGDFETLGPKASNPFIQPLSNFETLLGLFNTPDLEEGIILASPNPLCPGPLASLTTIGNNSAHLAGAFGNEEALCFPLSIPLAEGTPFILTYQAATKRSSCPATFEWSLSENPPCPGVFWGPNCTQFSPTAIGSQLITNFQAWGQYQITGTVPPGMVGRYLTVQSRATGSGENMGLLDNVSLVPQLQPIHITATPLYRQICSEQNITFEYAVCNDGGDAISGAGLTIQIPPGMSIIGGDFGANGISTLVPLDQGECHTFTVTINTGILPAGFSGQITVLPVGGCVPGPLPVINLAAANGTLVIQKTAPVGNVRAGDWVQFTLTVTNTSPTQTVSGIELHDILGTGWEIPSIALIGWQLHYNVFQQELIFDPIALPPGQTATITYQVRLLSTYIECSASNCLSVTAPPGQVCVLPEPVCLEIATTPNPTIVNGKASLLGVSMLTGQHVIQGWLEMDIVLPISNATLIFMPGAVLRYANGINGQITSSTLRGACGMWQGIQVTGNSTLEVTSSTVMDAEYGIWAYRNTKLRIWRNQFRQNHVSIFVPPIQAGQALNTVIFDLFQDNRFIYSPNLPFYAPVTFVYDGTQTLAGVWVNDNIFTNLGTNNTFDRVHVGIALRNTSARANNNRYINLQAIAGNFPSFIVPTAFRGTAVYSTATSPALGHYLMMSGTGRGPDTQPGDPAHITGQIHNCRYGVVMQNVGTGSGAIENLRMTDIGITGVHLSGQATSQTAVVRNNYIHARRECIFTQSCNAPFQLLTNSLMIMPNANTLTGAVRGIRVENSLSGPLNPFAIRENNIWVRHLGQFAAPTAFQEAIFVQGTNGGGIPSGGSTPNGGITGNDIWLQNADGTQARGIVLSGSKHLLVNCNDIQGNGTGGFGGTLTTNVNTNRQKGIFVSAATTNAFECNNANNTQQGMQFQGTCTGSRLQANSLGRHFLGLDMTSSGTNIGTQNGNFGNMFNGPFYRKTNTLNAPSFTAYGALGYTGIPFQFITNGAAPYQPHSWPSPWFISVPSTSPASCSAAYNVCGNYSRPAPDGFTTDDYGTAHGDTVGMGVHWEELLWSARRELYDRIAQDTAAVVNDAVLWDFYELWRSGSIGQFYQATEGWQQSLSDDPYEQFLASYRAQSEIYETQYHQLDSLVQAGDTTQFAARDTALARYQQTRLLLEEQAILQAVYIEQQALMAAAESGEAPANALHEANQQAVNEVYFATIALNVYALTPAQEAVIAPIAMLCPLAGGTAVYEARSLYSLVNDSIAYDDEGTCLQAGYIAQRPGKEVIAVPSLAVYPNPTSGMVTFAAIGATSTLRIAVFSLSGTLAADGIFADQTSVEVDMSQLPQGLYLYTVRDEAGVIVFTGKIAKQ